MGGIREGGREVGRGVGGRECGWKGSRKGEEGKEIKTDSEQFKTLYLYCWN